MKFLRTVSTRRLLAIIVGLVSAIVAGAAIAVAAQGSGPVPPPKPLPNAIHSALAAPAPAGITARISFSNHLIDASALQGSDPILSGATGRLWLTSDHRLRLELQSDNGDAQVVVNKRAFWVYDPSANTVYRGTLPADTTKPKHRAGADKLPSVAQLQKDLTRLAQHVNLSGAIPSDVAGHAAYTVRVSPKHDGGLLGAGELAWDAIRGVPLRVAVYAQNDSTPVLELKATNISYGKVSPSVFAINPPSTAKVVKIDTARTEHAGTARTRAAKHRGHHREVSGAAAVAKRLPFKLVAPGKLVGLPRQSVHLLDWGGHPAALITYGQNLGGVAVLEQTTAAAKSAGPAGGPAGGKAGGKNGHERPGLNLPTVSINGATGQELDTALGTLVRFDRGGVTYTVLGSVPAAAADAAARAL
jgi:outer membrane lipoprotein-sorting protein